ncbi:MAG TPA: hypothetical protein VMV27_11535 [Candidatus Binataceae bacterium]|nr:hypothetical protein [Candidatus Binataceae bacterium]
MEQKLCHYPVRSSLEKTLNADVASKHSEQSAWHFSATVSLRVVFEPPHLSRLKPPCADPSQACSEYAYGCLAIGGQQANQHL